MEVKFGELVKGDHFIFQNHLMVKTNRIKDGNDGCFYTAVDVLSGVHHKIDDGTLCESLRGDKSNDEI